MWIFVNIQLHVFFFKSNTLLNKIYTVKYIFPERKHNLWQFLLKRYLKWFYEIPRWISSLCFKCCSRVFLGIRMLLKISSSEKIEGLYQIINVILLALNFKIFQTQPIEPWIKHRHEPRLHHFPAWLVNTAWEGTFPSPA